MRKGESVTVFDTPSNLGGSFTVSIASEIDAENRIIWQGPEEDQPPEQLDLLSD